VRCLPTASQNLGTPHQPRGPLNIAHNLSSALVQLLECDYWFRTWIIQEFILATTLVIVWGKTTFAIDDLERVLRSEGRSLDRHCQIHSLRPKMSLVLYHIQQRKKKEQSGFLIYEWREASMLSQVTRCTDTRDRIFALLGLVSPAIAIRADYSSSVRAIYHSLLVITAKQESYPSMALFCTGFVTERANSQSTIPEH
jgi:hypothetical protein